jgi:iron(III) transport system ATP-binding protein
VTDAAGHVHAGIAAGISARGIHKSYGDRRVLAGVDLDVAAGTLTAVLGPSGCGKTTLLRILAGFDDPDRGVVRIAGQAVVGDGAVVPAHRRRVGLMPQEGALFPHLSVGGNVAFGMAARNGAAGEVAHWLEVVGLPGLADARPHELSGGQQQRVALARALAARPRVLLLDEPFAALDAGLRVRVREDIAEILREAGTTAVLVTHDQAEALSLADSVALLFDGAVAQHAAPADLYARPSNLQTARFVGATVELAGRCRGGIAHTALGAHPVGIPVPDGPVVVVLRPEQLHADGQGASGGERDAVVRACRFYGADTVLHVVLRDGTALRLRGAGDARVAAGTVVSVDVDGPVLAYPSPPGG